MGFSASLQGRAVHEALLGRQEAELRLLETMRRCLTTKLKHDREYASALASVATQSHKLERADELTGSLIARAWRTMMEELENTGKVIKSNADAVEVAALDKLNTLYSEKRKCRKAYQEEHTRLVSQISQLSEEVSRKKIEYQKNLEVYKLMRTRFEEHYVKSGRGGRKLDEVRDKYQKACRKLHLTHNEYVLLLRSAEEFERDFRITLLPGLLERQQHAQESYADTWRKLLEEVAHYYNFSTDKFREIHTRVEKGLQDINSNEEYIVFNDKTKSNSLPSISFTFDESLIKDSSVRLPINHLTVDNLTIDWLRNKLTELETSLRSGQERINSLLSEDTSITGTPSSRKSSTNEFHGGHVAALAELRCEERRISAQIETIRTALSELGCEEVPSGLDLTLDSTTDGDQNDNFQADGPQGLSPHRLVYFLRKPFKRKSAPPSPKPADRPPPHQEDANEEHTNQNKSFIDEEWFHGVLPREEVVRLLTREGDFLVRETTRNDESQTVLSVCWGGHKHFIVQTTTEGHYRFEGPAFSTIRELILHQFNCSLPVTSRSGAILRKPISRERWELNNDDVILLDKIGRGNFGDVYKAKLKTTKQMVAVKTCRMTLPEEHKKKFLQEGRILKQYEHPNIVKLIGICVQKQPIMIVMELVTGGSLLTFLRNNASTLILKQLLGMCRDAAAAMRYLETKNCIHRDLAARNCLIGQDNIVKISDFGMSREEEEYIVSDGIKQIPIKWTAPEALNFGKYTSLCDIWSYGILCWEIFAKGGTPYNGLSNTKAREKIDAGYRMPAPEGTPEEMYRLMLQCWDYQPENRPHFEQIYLVIDALFGAQR